MPLEAGRGVPAAVRALCAQLAPRYRLLVDAFGIPDHLVRLRYAALCWGLCCAALGTLCNCEACAAPERICTLRLPACPSWRPAGGVAHRRRLGPLQRDGQPGGAAGGALVGQQAAGGPGRLVSSAAAAAAAVVYM